VSSAALLSVDFNDRTGNPGSTPTNTQAGFLAWKVSGTTATSSALESQAVGTYTLTLQAFDDNQDENSVTTGIQNTVGQIDDRLRTTPTNSGAFTYSDLYEDIIFAGTSTGPTGGMDLTVSGGALLPNTQYLVSIYDFDSGSSPAPQPRTANWLDGNNSNALVVTTAMATATPPTSNEQYKFTGIAQTDSSGVLLLRGRNTTANAASGGVSIGVIINGFEIAEVPEPASFGLLLTAAVMVQLRRQRR